MKVKFIFISVVCMICLGAGILCRDTISHSIFKSRTRMSAWHNMKVQFDLNDLVGQKDDVTASWQDGIKEYRTKKGLKHVYDEYVNVGVFYVSDDFIKTSGSATGHMKLLKSIKSDGSVKEGETISVTYSCNYIPKKDNIYQTSNITPMIRQNECYLLVYDKIVNSDISEKFETHGAKLPINYSTGNSASWDISPLRLSDSQTLKIIEKGKVYTLEELSDYDLFTCGTGILQEWYRTKDAILRYYVGDNYAELAANWKRKERTGNE